MHTFLHVSGGDKYYKMCCTAIFFSAASLLSFYYLCCFALFVMVSFVFGLPAGSRYVCSSWARVWPPFRGDITIVYELPQTSGKQERPAKISIQDIFKFSVRIRSPKLGTRTQKHVKVRGKCSKSEKLLILLTWEVLFWHFSMTLMGCHTALTLKNVTLVPNRYWHIYDVKYVCWYCNSQ